MQLLLMQVAVGLAVRFGVHSLSASKMTMCTRRQLCKPGHFRRLPNAAGLPAIRRCTSLSRTSGAGTSTRRSKSDLKSRSSLWHDAVHERVCRFIACSRRIRVIRACAEGIANASNPKVTRELRSHKVRRTPSHITALVSREKGNPEDVMRSQPCRAIRLRVQRCNSACKRCNLRALRDIFRHVLARKQKSKNTKRKAQES
jgi:hypothetical protein